MAAASVVLGSEPPCLHIVSCVGCSGQALRPLTLSPSPAPPTHQNACRFVLPPAFLPIAQSLYCLHRGPMLLHALGRHPEERALLQVGGGEAREAQIWGESAALGAKPSHPHWLMLAPPLPPPASRDRAASCRAATEQCAARIGQATEAAAAC